MADWRSEHRTTRPADERRAVSDENESPEELEEIEVITTVVGDDGTVVVDDLRAVVDGDGNVLATDETIAAEAPDGTIVVDEVISVADDDGELVPIEEDVAVIEPDEG
jgi:hypothetical protein